MAEHKKKPSEELSIHGVEKTDETGRLCRMIIAVDGLEGDIRYGGQLNSFYDDPHDAAGNSDLSFGDSCIMIGAFDFRCFRSPSRMRAW